MDPYSEGWVPSPSPDDVELPDEGVVVLPEPEVEGSLLVPHPGKVVFVGQVPVLELSDHFFGDGAEDTVDKSPRSPRPKYDTESSKGDIPETEGTL